MLTCGDSRGAASDIPSHAAAPENDIAASTAHADDKDDDKDEDEDEDEGGEEERMRCKRETSLRIAGAQSIGMPSIPFPLPLPLPLLRAQWKAAMAKGTAARSNKEATAARPAGEWAP